jgi:hypothetical protein
MTPLLVTDGGTESGRVGSGPLVSARDPRPERRAGGAEKPAIGRLADDDPVGHNQVSRVAASEPVQPGGLGRPIVFVSTTGLVGARRSASRPRSDPTLLGLR